MHQDFLRLECYFQPKIPFLYLRRVFFYYISDLGVTLKIFFSSLTHAEFPLSCLSFFSIINFSSWFFELYFAWFSQALPYLCGVSSVDLTYSASNETFISKEWRYFILLFILEKWLLFFFHPCLSPSLVWSSTFWFFVYLLYTLFQRPSISIIVHASWALWHVMFQHVLILSWRNFSLDIYSLSLSFSFVMVMVMVLMPFLFLGSALAETFAEVTD